MKLCFNLVGPIRFCPLTEKKYYTSMNLYTTRMKRQTKSVINIGRHDGFISKY